MSPGSISGMLMISESSAGCCRKWIEKYRFRFGMILGNLKPQRQELHHPSRSMSMKRPKGRENSSGGGCPKFTKRKWPDGRTSPHSMVAISRALPFVSIAERVASRHRLCHRRLMSSNNSGVVFP